MKIFTAQVLQQPLLPPHPAKNKKGKTPQKMKNKERKLWKKGTKKKGQESIIIPLDN